MNEPLATLEPIRLRAKVTRPPFIRALTLLLVVALSAACGSSARSPADAQAQPPTPEQSARDALAALKTTPEQDDALLALVGKMAIVVSRTGKARRAFTDVLIKSLLRGKVEAAVMDPPREEFEAALRVATPDVLACLNELHAILTPVQRTQLIDGFSARLDDAEAKRKAKNEEMLDELDIGLVQKVELGLAMKDKLEPLRPAFTKMKQDAKVAGDAFKSDSFDATELELVKSDLGKLYLESTVVLVGALAPELEYEQRRTLADIIRHRLNGGDRQR